MSPQIHLDKHLYKDFWKMYLLALKKDLYLVSRKACDTKNMRGCFHPRLLVSRLTKASTWTMHSLLSVHCISTQGFKNNFKIKKSTYGSRYPCTAAPPPHTQTSFPHFSTMLVICKKKHRFLSWNFPWVNDARIKSQGLPSERSFWVFSENLGHDVNSRHPSRFPRSPGSLHPSFNVI